jgi:hypothetical protein
MPNQSQLDLFELFCQGGMSDTTRAFSAAELMLTMWAPSPSHVAR